MKVCKSCGEENTNDSLYCCNCGASSFVFKEEVACPHCGAANAISNEHCTECGALLSADADNKTADISEQTPEIGLVVPSEQPLAETDYTTLPTPETAKCPSCGAQVPVTAIYCNKCGANVAALHEHRIVRRRLCPFCGKPNPMEAGLCKHCFGSMEGGNVVEMQVEHVTSYVGDSAVMQTVLSDMDGQKQVCPNCGALNDPDEEFCDTCGLKLVVEDVKKYCPNCGAENPSDSKFCSNCQWSFTGEEPDKISKWKCPVCGNINDDEDKFCSNCSTPKQQSEGKSEVKA